MRRLSSIRFVAAALAVLGIAAVIAAPGCRIWRDYDSEVPFDRSAGDAGNGDVGARCASGDEPTAISLEADDSETRNDAICHGHTRWFSVDLEAGERLETRVEYPTETATLTLELFRRPETDASARVAAEPVWDDASVRLRWLIRESGTYYLRLASKADGSETDERIDYTHRLTRTSVADRVYWIAPEGNDDADGTDPTSAWASWSHAVDQLAPGDMLVVRPGTWTDRSGCDGAMEPCRAETELPEIDCEDSSRDVRRGTADAPIRVAAERERRAALVNDSVSSALEIRRCRHWEVRGLVLRGQEGASDPVPDVLELTRNRQIRIQRMVLAGSNSAEWGPMTRIRDSEEILLRENAYYDFHHHGLIVRESSDVRVERNFFHSRDAPDADNYSTRHPNRGEHAIKIIQAEDVTVANTIVENAYMGVNVAARGGDELDATDRIELLGNVARDVDFGFHLKSVGDECSSAESPDCLIEEARLVDNVAMEGSTDSANGFVIKGGVDNVIDQSSSIEMDHGFRFDHGWPPGDEQAITDGLRVEQSLALGPGSTGFDVVDEIDRWSIADTNAHGIDEPYDLSPRPDDVTYEFDPELGGCRVTIPEDSPLRNRTDERIGADLTYRYDRSERSGDKLWHQVHGGFPCGRPVPGISGPGVPESCHNVHRRLPVGTSACPIP